MWGGDGPDPLPADLSGGPTPQGSGAVFRRSIVVVVFVSGWASDDRRMVVVVVVGAESVTGPIVSWSTTWLTPTVSWARVTALALAEALGTTPRRVTMPSCRVS